MPRPATKRAGARLVTRGLGGWATSPLIHVLNEAEQRLSSCAAYIRQWCSRPAERVPDEQKSAVAARGSRGIRPKVSSRDGASRQERTGCSATHTLVLRLQVRSITVIAGLVRTAARRHRRSSQRSACT